MTDAKKYNEFAKKYPGVIKRRVPLSRYCTFKIGGPADLLIEAKNPTQLVEIVKLAHQLKLRYLVIGAASNLLFDDAGFRGLVVRYLANNIEVDKTATTAMAWAGCSLNRLVKHAAMYNLGGLDFLANIPGSVGGAIVGNAGCYGKAIAETLIEVDLFNAKTGKVATVSPKELDFTYRSSELKAKPHLIVLSARFKLLPDNKNRILKAIDEEKQLRWGKHPHAACAGSFFKNPPGEAAWKLINAAGMRGVTVGGARISTKHPNFLVNIGGAKSKDVKKLAAKVIEAVKKRMGTTLEPEIRYISAG
ncbi:UDP-N-acetylmuramate dehydrogenase [Patescibacteria group bacterium]|nr:UDP-N-acetylmuramate dehydrogenase [Patescibacteria group bacterium]